MRLNVFDKETVYFGKDRGAAKLVCASRAQAELVARFAELGLRGDRRLPEGENECREVLAKLDTRIADARNEFETLASNRISDEKSQAEIVGLMVQWLVHGKPALGAPVERAVVDIASEASAEL